MEELDEIVSILWKHLAEGLTDSERERLEEWAVQHPAYRDLLTNLSDENSLFAGYTDYLHVYDEAVSRRLQKIESKLMESVAASTGKVYRKKRFFRWLPYAAAVLIASTTATWIFFLRETSYQASGKRLDVEDILPGTNRATLQLANGRTIRLSEAQTGIIVRGGSVTYEDQTSVAELGDAEASAKPDTLTLTTPKGGTYQLTLPDSSKVWLNAASVLKYPSAFRGSERIVELEGEGYFAVATDKDRPFKVISKGQEVDVLGTEFNISAYADEKQIKTTLLVGSVKVSNLKSQISNLLNPGTQSTIRGATTDVHEVDVQQYIAWKEGRFHFYRTPFNEVIRQVARWYDVDIVYQGSVPKETFSGKMGRDLSLGEMLNLLDISDAAIRMEGGKLIIH